MIIGGTETAGIEMARGQTGKEIVAAVIHTTVTSEIDEEGMSTSTEAPTGQGVTMSIEIETGAQTIDILDIPEKRIITIGREGTMTGETTRADTDRLPLVQHNVID